MPGSPILADLDGQVVATALFGPEHELLVTCADGRQLTFQMPESYRE